MKVMDLFQYWKEIKNAKETTWIGNLIPNSEATCLWQRNVSLESSKIKLTLDMVSFYNINI